MHSSESEIVNCSISVLLHWFGPLKYYSYMLLEQVFTLTVFTGDFVLIFKVVTSRMASWATKGSKYDWNILLVIWWDKLWSL